MTQSIPNSITRERASTLIKSLMQRTNSNLPILGLNHHLGEQNIYSNRKKSNTYILVHVWLTHLSVRAQSIIGSTVQTVFFFKPFGGSLDESAVQLLSWGCGIAMAKYLPTHVFNTFGYRWTMNPGTKCTEKGVFIFVEGEFLDVVVGMD